MNIIQVHNFKNARGGEETMFWQITEMLKEYDQKVVTFQRDSRTINSLKLKLNAFFNGIYSISSYRQFKELLESIKVDIVHIHNPYPLISYSIIDACTEMNVPIVISSANFRLICPTDRLWRKSQTCKSCLNGKEYYCAVVNCEGRILYSIGYAIRHAYYYRKKYLNRIEYIISPSNFVKSHLVNAGIPEEKIIIIPNFVELPKLNNNSDKQSYIGYAGRITDDKGIGTLLKSVKDLGIPLRIAGDNSQYHYKFENLKDVRYVGHLDKSSLSKFYSKSKFIVVPSEVPETFGLVAAEAMSHSIPVIASRIGGLTEVVDDGVNGLLFEPANDKELSEKISFLWNNPEICRKMGKAGREKVKINYLKNTYYEELLKVYKSALQSYSIGKNK